MNGKQDGIHIGLASTSIVSIIPRESSEQIRDFMGRFTYKAAYLNGEKVPLEELTDNSRINLVYNPGVSIVGFLSTGELFPGCSQWNPNGAIVVNNDYPPNTSRSRHTRQVRFKSRFGFRLNPEERGSLMDLIKGIGLRNVTGLIDYRELLQGFIEAYS